MAPIEPRSPQGRSPRPIRIVAVWIGGLVICAVAWTIAYVIARALIP